jgi:hypothetical protein
MSAAVSWEEHCQNLNDFFSVAVLGDYLKTSQISPNGFVSWNISYQCKCPHWNCLQKIVQASQMFHNYLGIVITKDKLSCNLFDFWLRQMELMPTWTWSLPPVHKFPTHCCNCKAETKFNTCSDFVQYPKNLSSVHHIHIT